MTRMKERQSNLELLRILCALFVLAFHLISQSDALGDLNTQNFTFSVFFHAGGRMACNVFVMIGAYFLTQKHVSFKQIFRLEFKTIAACLFVNFLMLLFQKDYYSQVAYTTKDIIFQFLPILGKPYWFIQDYIFLLLLSPLLNALLNCESIKKYLDFTIKLFLFFVVLFSFPPFFDNSIFTSDLLWFCFVYVVIGRISQNNFEFFRHKNRCLILAIAIYVLMCLATLFFDKIKADYLYAWEIRFFYISMYQNIFCFLCALFLFYYFVNVRIKSNRIINVLGRHTLGVYIVHQIPILYSNGQGWIWKDAFKVNAYFNTNLFPLYSVLVTLLVFLICVVVDYLLDFVVNIMVGSYPITHLIDKAQQCLQKPNE